MVKGGSSWPLMVPSSVLDRIQREERGRSEVVVFFVPIMVREGRFMAATT